jgi:hypothetical protein
MQLFIRDGRHVVVEAEASSTVADVKAAYLLKAYGATLCSPMVSVQTCLERAAWILLMRLHGTALALHVCCAVVRRCCCCNAALPHSCFTCSRLLK